MGVPLEWRRKVVSSYAEDYCVILLKRRKTATHLADFSMFPGDMVHSMDYAIAKTQAEDEDEVSSTALRIAALRTVFAETGAFLAEPPPPNVLRDATRDILRRDGPRTFLDCMVAWDGGNPNPSFTLCPFEELAVLETVDERVPSVAKLATHFFVTEVPEAAELGWMRVSRGDKNNSKLLCLKPSEIIQQCQAGTIQLAHAEHAMITMLRDKLPMLDGLASFLSDGLAGHVQASKL